MASKFTYPDKYSKTLEELAKYTEKQKEKYFKKKARYLARKLLLKPTNAVEEFQKLVTEKYESGYIDEEEYKQLVGNMSDAIDDYSTKSSSAIQMDLKKSVKDLFRRS